MAYAALATPSAHFTINIHNLVKILYSYSPSLVVGLYGGIFCPRLTIDDGNGNDKTRPKCILTDNPAI